MEDEEDVGKSVDVAEQPLSEPLIGQNDERDTVSNAVDSPIIEPTVEGKGVAEPVCGGGEAVVLAEVTDGRESEVENVEDSRLVREGEVIVADGAQPLAVGEELGGGGEVEVEERETAVENVEESKPEGEDDGVKDGAQPEAVEEVRDEVAGEGGAVESLTAAVNAGDSIEEHVVVDEARLSPLVDTRDELGSEGVTDEGAEKETGCENTENVEAKEEEEVKGEERVERDEEMAVDGGEVSASGKEVPITEGMAIGNEEVVEKDEEMVAWGVEAPENEEEVEKDGANAEDEKGKMANAGELVEEKLENSDGMKEEAVEDEAKVVEEEAKTIEDEVKMVEGESKVVNTDELVEDNAKTVEYEEKAVSTEELVQEKAEKDEIAEDEDVQMVDDEAKTLNTDELAREVKQENKGSKVEEEVPGEEERKGENNEESEGLELSPVATKDEDDLMVEGEGTPIADTEMEMDKSEGSGSGGKRRRGRNAKAAPATPVKTPPKKLVGEDVCFICLDGGDLVLCDRRGCPKAYHPSCVDHDADFFQTKGRWNCGWHLCNKCGKNAYFMCYTCQFSLCKGCSKDAAIFCVRGNKGFCESCMKTISVIESSEQNEMGKEAFSDKSSWEFLFKDYWLEQKEKLCITSDELGRAKNPWKDSDKLQPSTGIREGNHDTGADSDSLLGNLDSSGSRRKKAKRKSKSVDYDTDSSLEKDVGIAKRKPKRKSKSQAKDTTSDSELSSQDTTKKRGKRARRLSKSRSKGSASGVGGGDDFSDGNTEWASKELLEFVMHMNNGDQSVLTQFDVQNLLLEYIKRNKLRDPRRQSQIICDPMLQKLFGKPRVGHFEMLKLLESHFFLKDDHTDDNQGSVVDTDMTQLDADDNNDSVLDGGRSRGKKSRKRGEERGLQSNLDDYAAIDMHNINLLFLRRNLMEALMKNTETFHDKVVGAFVRIRISGSSQKQDIYRLVQITGTSKAAEPYKVGKRTTDVMLEILNLDKTEIISLDIISNQEFTEDECKRLRQSIKCGLINRMTVGDIVDKARELNEVRVTDWLEAEILRLSHLRDRASEKGRKKELRVCVEKLELLKTPEERRRRLAELPEVHADPKMDPSCDSDNESEMDATGQASSARPRESGFSRRGRDHFSPRKGGSASSDSWSANARPPSKKWEPNRSFSGKGFSGRREDQVFASPTREPSWNNGVDKGTPRSNSWEKQRTTPETSVRTEYSAVRSDVSPASLSESSHVSPVVGQADPKVSETEKLWHYRDPTDKVQGPFSMAQLRKWSNTGYFPTGLRIWRTSHTDGDSFLLTDALAGRFHKELPSVGLNSDIGSKHPRNVHISAGGGRYDSSSLPSPTPGKGPFQSSGQRAGNERLPSPTPTSPSDPSSVGRSNFSRQAKGGAMGSMGENLPLPSVRAVQQASNQQFFSSPGARPVLPSGSGTANGQQIGSQPTVHMGNQQFVSPNTMINQVNAAPNAGIQLGAGQNPSVYSHGWSSGHVARPESVSANLTPSNPSAIPAQVAYGQWAAAPASYGAGYAAAPGNMAASLSSMPSQNAWRPAPNMAWAGQQQVVNQNMAWAASQTGAMGQHAMPGASAMPGGSTTMGWSGAGPNPSAGSTNPGWVGPPSNAAGWGGDQNQHGGGPQYNRQSSFGNGGGGQRVCKFHETGH